MSAPTKTRSRARLQRAGRHVCPTDTHDYPRPLQGHRPVVVFCTRCQTGKTLG